MKESESHVDYRQARGMHRPLQGYPQKTLSGGFVMLSDLKTVYWDACVPLSYINGTADRIPHIEGLLQQSGKDLQIITSVFTLTEVAFAKAEQDAKVLDATVEAKISTLWQVGAPIKLVEFYEVIAARARELMRAAIRAGGA